MTQIHLVFRDQYEYQRVVGAYSDRGEAMRMQALEDPDNEIDSLEIDPPRPYWLPEGHTLWRASVTLAKGARLVDPDQEIYAHCEGFHECRECPPLDVRCTPADYVAPGATHLSATVSAPDKQGAADLARTLFNQCLHKRL